MILNKVVIMYYLLEHCRKMKMCICESWEPDELRKNLALIFLTKLKSAVKYIKSIIYIDYEIVPIWNENCSNSNWELLLPFERPLLYYYFRNTGCMSCSYIKSWSVYKDVTWETLVYSLYYDREPVKSHT